MGIGDDAAVLDSSADRYLLAAVDMLVDGIHFRLGTVPPSEVGRRAIAVNVSDIAAMGGTPAYALISLALSPHLPAEIVEDMYGGITAEAGHYETEIVGGNVTATGGPMCIDVTLLGYVPREELVLRSGGRPGDLLVVTGHLGAQAALRLWRERQPEPSVSAPASLAGVTAVPSARVQVARALAGRRLAHAMLDLSDGLAGDLHHLCAASGVGAVIRARDIPVSDAAREVAPLVNEDVLDLALTGGEDYELLIAIGAEALREAGEAAHPIPLTAIGQLLPRESGITIEDEDGRRRELRASGWTHF